ncbi:MAG: cyclase family protein [Bdellovibrionota bacterium]
MPYVLSPKIVLNSEMMWMEGPIYETENLYKIQDGKLPPVNYDLHKIKPHSLTHAEGSLHVLANGKSVDQYESKYFYGSCLVIKIEGNNYQSINPDKGIYHWEVTKEELIKNIQRVTGSSTLRQDKLILSTQHYPLNKQGFHDPNYVLTLSQAAAEYLISHPNFNMYGTSWKSSDFMPGSPKRPIHKTLFQQAIIFELLDVKNVPEGEYFFVGFPLLLENSSESPVTPVLFSKSELR